MLKKHINTALAIALLALSNTAFSENVKFSEKMIDNVHITLTTKENTTQSWIVPHIIIDNRSSVVLNLNHYMINVPRTHFSAQQKTLYEEVGRWVTNFNIFLMDNNIAIGTETYELIGQKTNVISGNIHYQDDFSYSESQEVCEKECSWNDTQGNTWHVSFDQR